MTDAQQCYLFGLLEGCSSYEVTTEQAVKSAGSWWVALCNGISRSTLFTDTPIKVLDALRDTLGPDEYRGTPANKVPQNKLKVVLEGLRRDLTVPPRRPPAAENFDDLLGGGQCA